MENNSNYLQYCKQVVGDQSIDQRLMSVNNDRDYEYQYFDILLRCHGTLDFNVSNIFKSLQAIDGVRFAVYIAQPEYSQYTDLTTSAVTRLVVPYTTTCSDLEQTLLCSYKGESKLSIAVNGLNWTEYEVWDIDALKQKYSVKFKIYSISQPDLLIRYQRSSRYTVIFRKLTQQMLAFLRYVYSSAVDPELNNTITLVLINSEADRAIIVGILRAIFNAVICSNSSEINMKKWAERGKIIFATEYKQFDIHVLYRLLNQLVYGIDYQHYRGCTPFIFVKSKDIEEIQNYNRKDKLYNTHVINMDSQPGKQLTKN